VPLALCCMSHSPLLNLPGPSRDLLDDIDGAIGQARNSSRITIPNSSSSFRRITTTVLLQVDAAFCIGTSANGVGDYGTHAGPLNVSARHRGGLRGSGPRSGVDAAVSASMDVDHGTVQPLEKLFGDAISPPVVPIFINAIAAPLGPLRRCRALGTAVGNYLATLDKRVW